MKKPEPISTAGYKKLIKHFEALLTKAIAKEEKLRAIYEEAQSKVPVQTTISGGSRVGARPLLGEKGRAIILAADNLSAHHLEVTAPLRGDIRRAEEVISLLEDVNQKISQKKFRNIHQ